jgi:hypothetical protein
MIRNVARKLGALGKWYLHSWVFLLWGAFCFSAGGMFALSTLYSFLVANGKL